MIKKPTHKFSSIPPTVFCVLHVLVRRVPFDESVLELDHSPDDELEHREHIIAFLRVHHAVVALL